MRIIKNNVSIQDCNFEKIHTYKNGTKIPVFSVKSMYGLNQIIGYAKFINRNYGTVYYRGENQLYESLLPSLFRKTEKDTRKSSARIKKCVKSITSCKKFMKELKLEGNSDDKFIIEGMLQHYGAKTSFIDIVDNHWVSMWMGMHKFISNEQWAFYKKRTPTSTDKYLYILLLALPFPEKHHKGVETSADFVKVDLRTCLPSIFLRPHAQHALIFKRKVKPEEQRPEFLDMATQVVGILQIELSEADKWLGNGLLVTQQNLFPNPVFDKGYKIILDNETLFSPFNVVKYVY